VRKRTTIQITLWTYALLFALVPFVTAYAQDLPKIELVRQQSGGEPLAFSADGRHIVSWNNDSRTLQLWDTATGKLVRTIGGAGHYDFVRTAAFSPDSRYVLTGDHDNALKLWDTTSGMVVRTFEGHTSSTNSAAFSSDGRFALSAADDKTLKLWEVASGKLLRTFEGHAESVNTAIFSPDNMYVLSGSEDHTVKLWEANTGTLIRTFEGHSDAVRFVTFSPDGTRILSTDENNTLSVWNTSNGHLVCTFEHYWEDTLRSPSGVAIQAAFSPDGKRVVSKGHENKLHLWDATTGRLIGTIEQKELIGDIVFSPDRTRFVSGNMGLFDAATGDLIRSLGVRIESFSSVAFSADGGHIFSTVGDWDAATGQRIHRFPDDTLAYSPDGAKTLSRGAENSLELRETASGTLIHRFKGHTEAIEYAAFSPNGAHIISASREKLMLWDAVTGTFIHKIIPANKIERVHSYTAKLASIFGPVSFSPDGERILAPIRLVIVGGSGVGEGVVQIWDTSTGTLVKALGTGQSYISSAQFTPDGTRIAVAASNITLWDVATEKLVYTLKRADGADVDAAAIAFSPDGTRILVGGDKARVWDAATGMLIRTFEGITGAVIFSPDGKRIITTSQGAIQLWDAVTEKELVTMMASSSGEWLTITAVGFFDASDNGTQMLAVVRGLEVLPIKRLRALLQRKDIIRALLSGNTREYQEAAGVLDLTKVAGEVDTTQSRDIASSTATFHAATYLCQRPKIELVPQLPHARPINPLAFSHDGKYVLSGSYTDRSMQLWDIASGGLIRTFQNGGRVELAEFSPDGKYVLLGDGEYYLELWDVVSGEFVRGFRSSKYAIHTAAFSPDGIHVISGPSGYNYALTLWELRTGRLIRTFKGHSDGTNALAFSADGTRFLSASDDTTIKLWETATGKLLHTFEGHTEAVRSVVYSPDGTRFLSTDRSTLKVWNVETGELVSSFGEHNKGVQGRWRIYTAFSPDGQRIVSQEDKSDALFLWDATTGKLLNSFVGNENRGSAVAFSPDGAHILTSGMRLLDTATGRQIGSFGEAANGVQEVAFSADGTRIFIRRANGTGDRSPDAGLPVRLFQNANSEKLLAFSPDGATTLSEGPKHSLQLSEAATGKLVTSFTGHTHDIIRAYFHPSGRFISVSQDKTVKIWDGLTGKMVNSFTLAKDHAGPAALSPSGDRLVASAYTENANGYTDTAEMKLWDVPTGRLIHEFKVMQVSAVVFSPDGTRILQSEYGVLKLWDAASGELITTFRGHEHSVGALAFSTDGKRALSGSSDNTARLWNTATGELIRTFEAHGAEVTSVAFSADGARVLTGSLDGTVRLWDTNTGKELLMVLPSSSGGWVALTSAGFFDFVGNGAQLFTAVRGLKILPFEPFSRQLHRRDVIRSLILGKGDVYKEAMGEVDLESILAQ
jgi:WD40 repeat protein